MMRSAVEGHHRQTDHLRVVLDHQPLDGGEDATLDEDQIGDGDVMTGTRVPGERRERPVGHPHRQGGRVLERVRHREKEHSHGSAAASGYAESYCASRTATSG